MTSASQPRLIIRTPRVVCFESHKDQQREAPKGDYAPDHRGHQPDNRNQVSEYIHHTCAPFALRMKPHNGAAAQERMQ
jgi:hypothetical protein